MKEPKSETILVAITVTEVPREESKAQDTSSGGGIFSRAPTKAYTDGWETIWGKAKGDGLLADPDKKDLN